MFNRITPWKVLAYALALDWLNSTGWTKICCSWIAVYPFRMCRGDGIGGIGGIGGKGERIEKRIGRGRVEAWDG
jgi:hypothetical protein